MPKNIDQRINEFFQHGTIRPNEVRNWHWHGCPGPFSDNANVPFDLDVKIYLEIMRATNEECMLSESDYVRQCKSWILRKKDLINTNLL